MGKFFSATDISSEISKMYPELNHQDISYHCYMILSNPRIEYTHSYSELREIIKNTIDEPEEIDISEMELCNLDDFDYNEGIKYPLFPFKCEFYLIGTTYKLILYRRFKVYIIELVFKGELYRHKVSLIQKVHFILSFAMFDTYTVYKDNQVILQGKNNKILEEIN